MDFRCDCGKRFGRLVRDETQILCPKCGTAIDITEFNKQLEEARRSILDRPGDSEEQVRE